MSPASLLRALSGSLTSQSYQLPTRTGGGHIRVTEVSTLPKIGFLFPKQLL